MYIKKCNLLQKEKLIDGHRMYIVRDESNILFRFVY